MSRQLHIALVGAGNRAGKYLACLPEDVTVSAVVEPDVLRRERLLERCPGAVGYRQMEDLVQAAPLLDAVIVAAPDALHVPIAVCAASRGWHILMEKPVALTLADYQSLMEATSGVTVGVCLEMRFHPYWQKMRELVLSGAVGAVEEILHTEQIGADRMSHTFVRGLWASKAEAGPIFLSKCSHDTDFLLWLTGGKAVSVRSEGGLSRFKAAEAPQGSTERCLHCPVDCPYSAVKLYRERQAWTDGFTVPQGRSLAAVIEEELARGRYGRCVYHCANDVYDHQKVAVTLDSGIRLRICLDGLSLEEGRTTLIRGSHGVLRAADWQLWLSQDGGPQECVGDFRALGNAPLHGGADRLLVQDFFQALRSGTQPGATLSSTLEAHRICYLAG